MTQSFRQTYGATELQYAELFARHLAEDEAFRCWVIQQIEFSDFGQSAVLLLDEMTTRRAASASGLSFPWRN